MAEPVVQSIGGEMSRAFGWHLRDERPTAKPLFLGVAAAMLVATAGVACGCVRRSLGVDGADPDGFLLGAVIALSLAIYPGTKQHYGVLLALPAWALWAARDRLPRVVVGEGRVTIAPELAAASIAATWAAVAVGVGGHSWWVFLLWWAAMLALAIATRGIDEPAEALSSHPVAPR
jgi:hypothetical protein